MCGADEAYRFLWLMFGTEHPIVRGVKKLRAEGKRIHVNLHSQDNRDVGHIYGVKR